MDRARFGQVLNEKLQACKSAVTILIATLSATFFDSTIVQADKAESGHTAMN